jgi:hypothetical protein
VAGGADAQVGVVGGQAARAAGGAQGGEGDAVVGVQRGGQRRGELDVGEVGQGAPRVVARREDGRVHLQVWRREDAGGTSRRR